MFGQKYKRENIIATQKITLPDFQDYMACIQIHGSREVGEIIFTFESSTAENLLQMIDINPEDVENHTELLHSALGELANVVVGTLMTCESFLNFFGSVKISPPFVWDMNSPQEACIPLRLGFKSAVIKGDKFIQTFISTAKAHSVDITVVDEPA